MPAASLSVVLLPAPFLPTMPSASPGAISKERSSTATKRRSVDGRPVNRRAARGIASRRRRGTVRSRNDLVTWRNESRGEVISHLLRETVGDAAEIDEPERQREGGADDARDERFHSGNA